MEKLTLYTKYQLEIRTKKRFEQVVAELEAFQKLDGIVSFKEQIVNFYFGVWILDDTIGRLYKGNCKITLNLKISHKYGKIRGWYAEIHLSDVREAIEGEFQWPWKKFLNVQLQNLLMC